MARTTTADTQTVAVEYLDPATLLVDVNVRHDARLDKDFVASVKESGVLVPIVAVRTTEGAPRVRFGHRRALAAIEAGLPTVPVVVAADEGTDTAAQVERLVSQYAENEHRTGLSTAERVDVAAQLSLLGVSAAQITKRTRMPRAQVDAALAVAKSDLAKAATARYDFLDLTQAAVVAEFEDAPETVKALIAAAKTGQFDHVAQRARDARAEAAEREAFAAPLRDAGITIIDRPGYSSPVKRLDNLTDSPETREPITPDQHATCPGHACYLAEEWVWVPSPRNEQEASDTPQNRQQGNEQDTSDADGTDLDGDDMEPAYDDDEQDGQDVRQWTAVYVCTDPDGHGHCSRWGGHGDTTRVPGEKSEAEREADRNARREVIANNKAWKSAEVVRREWVRALLKRKTAPKGTIGFLAACLAHGDHEIRRAMEGSHERGRDLLGLDTDQVGWGVGTRQLLDALDGATDARAQVVALGLILGAYEDATGTHSWRNVSRSTTDYLTFLTDHGYTLSDVERRACGQDPLPEPGDHSTGTSADAAEPAVTGAA